MELYHRYIFWVASFVPLFVLENMEERLVYLGSLSGVTTLLFLVTSLLYENKPDTKKLVFLAAAVFHSIIHNVWPFLTSEGYNMNETPFYDVLCHFIMIIMCYCLINKKNNYTRFFIFGSFLNVVASFFDGNIETASVHVLFSWLSVFQAISTAYWISTLICYDKWNNHSKHFLGMSLFIVGTWGIYMYDDSYVGLSMNYRYIEALFITSSVVSFVPLS